MLTRQVLYHLSHAASPFSSGDFGDRVLLFSWGSLSYMTLLFIFPDVTGMTGMYHCAQLFLLRWGRSHNLFLPRLASNHNPPYLSLSNS
jgi:hypothetical protein